MPRHLHQSQLLIQNTQIGDKNAEKKAWQKSCNQKILFDSKTWDAEFADDEQDAKKMMASEALNSLGIVKCFAEIHGDNQMNVMLNELIRQVETKVLSKYYSYIF